MKPTIWTLCIPGWIPTPLNKLLTRHWAAAGRLKRQDQLTILDAVRAYGVPPADTKRRVELTVIYPKGKRMYDKDAFDKSLHDALVTTGAIKNDSPAWLEAAEPVYARGDSLCSYITIQEV